MRAASGTTVIFLFRACHGMVEEQVTAFRDSKTVFFHIAVCRRLRAHSLQLAFHYTDNDQRQHNADDD